MERTLTDKQLDRLDKLGTDSTTRVSYHVVGWDELENGPILRHNGNLKVLGANGRLRAYIGV